MPKRHALAALALASLLGLFAQLLFFRQPLGLNALLITVLFLAAAWTHATRQLRFAAATPGYR